MNRLRALFLSALVLMLVVPNALAVPVWHTDVGVGDYIGSRTSPTGVTGTDGWSSGFTINWRIVDNGNGTYTYNYSVTTERKDLSHIIFEVSDNFTEENFWDATPEAAENDPNTYSGADPSNPGLPANIFGLKFNTDGTAVFTSDRAPMWGNFYAKDGVSTVPGTDDRINVIAYNNGLTNSGSESITDFIAVPDHDSPPVIPEPATVALFGLGLGLIGLKKMRKRED